MPRPTTSASGRSRDDETWYAGEVAPRGESRNPGPFYPTGQELPAWLIDRAKDPWFVTKQVLPSRSDLQVWGRALKSLPGAYGSDESDIQPTGLDGHLWVHVPLGEDQIRSIWIDSGIGTTHPESGWHSIDRFEHFILTLAGYKLKSGVFLPRYSWLVIFGFGLGDHSDPSPLTVGGVGRKTVPSIVDAFDLLEAVTMGIEPIPTTANGLSHAG